LSATTILRVIPKSIRRSPSVTFFSSNLHNPVFGVGVTNYPWRVVEYEITSGEIAPNKRLQGGRVAHSLYFTLLPELGTVGTICFVLALVGAIGNLRKTIKREAAFTAKSGTTFVEASARATLVGLVAFLVTGIFLSVLYYPSFWYLIGFAYVLNRVSSEACGDADTSDSAVSIAV